uniref:Uncharacterized protein n=1 Tax=Leptobrachium leishanense TaxID=445787 RepID=A0A8C5P5Z0_9ANUR
HAGLADWKRNPHRVLWTPGGDIGSACAAMSPHADFDKAAENIRKLKTKPTDDEMWGIYDLYNHNKGLSKEDAMALIEKYGI